jgi:hypothetical protein
MAGNAVPATTAALAAQCAQLGTDAPVVLSVNGRSGDALLRSTLAPGRRIVIHGCNFGDRAGVWLVPVYDGNAVATGVVPQTGTQQTESVFIGELGGPLQPVGGQAGRFVLVLMRVIPYSNIYDSRAAAVCCFSPAVSGSP